MVRKHSDTMPAIDYLKKKLLSKQVEMGRQQILLFCQAAGYTEEEAKEAIKKLRKEGYIYCTRREEFFKLT